ncbi:MAG TPA: hypothetical protein VJ302_09650, partial [Blastocatellia bacterium]|nr:hypothetical protein [Blastocatellia bacterium]
LSFNNFIVAFRALLGSPDQPSPAEMQRFADFQLQVLPPPNPVRGLDDSLTAAQQRGKDFYLGARPSDGATIPGLEETKFNCNGCHVLDPAQGLFGTGRNASLETTPQTVKIPHLRNLYTKVGMFGFPGPPNAGFQGDQIRGFGLLKDGSIDNLFSFFNGPGFRPRPEIGFPEDAPDQTRRDVEQFMLAFDTDLAPIVGQQVTLNRAHAAARRVDLLIQRAEAPFNSKELGGAVRECDLVAQVVLGGCLRSFRYDPMARKFISTDGTTRLSDRALRALAATPGQEVTYTCFPPGSGARLTTGR